MATADDLAASFIEAACVPLDRAHVSGTLERANSILSAHPEIATSSVHTAAILGDAIAVRRFIDEDRSNAAGKGGPRDWDALTHLCFSRYLRLDQARSDGFVRAATALLDAGANANTGWWENTHQPMPEWESALYGAAGVAHNADVARLLVERGAYVNDGEVTYHTPESYDNGALKVLVESGKLTADSLAIMLLRKADWHDYEGIKYLLERGADPNRRTGWGNTAFHNAILSDNSLEIIELMLDHGGDPMIVAHRPNRVLTEYGEKSGIEMAARGGRSDVFETLERRGIPVELHGVERLIAACARNDSTAVRSIREEEPELVELLLAEGGRLLAAFAITGNTDGVRQLLDLGVNVDTLFVEGNGYWDIARNSTALHIACWRASHEVVKLLIERGAGVNLTDAQGRTALSRAVKACVDSYWTRMRAPDSVAALLDAGASTAGVIFPSGYAAIDELLASHMN